MIDVSDKPPTRRTAWASAQVRLSASTVQRLAQGDLPKGDVLAAARLAGIMGAKHTPLLVPLCHPLPLTGIRVECLPLPALERVYLRTSVTAFGPTGVEMEALTAAVSAALTVYDMTKAVEPGTELGPVRVLAKVGGRSGDWLAPSVGRVACVCLSERKGTKKVSVPEIELVPEEGVRGDAHAGPGPRQVSLLGSESIAEAVARGVQVGPGDFAENITTEGLELPAVPVGAPLVVGGGVGVVTQIGKECLEPCEIGRQLGECVMPRQGIFMRVIHGGPVRPGDLIEVLCA